MLALPDDQVQVGNVRRTRAGAILLEVDGKEQVDRLSSHLREAIGEVARVSRPTRNTSILILNIAEWLDKEQVKVDILAADSELAGVTVRIRNNVGGGRVAQLNVAIEMAMRLADRKVLKIGWGMCRIILTVNT